MPGALSHVRVLDLSRILAGPWAAQVLGDLGAEVIKIEQPETGDDTRGWGPPYLKDQDGVDTQDSTYFLCTNRNKKSVAIDFTQPDGQRLIRELAAQCDVVVENFKVGGLAKYGLDYASLRDINPALIYCSITGFGQDGPYASRAGYDFLIQGLGGLMSITGHPDGAPGGGPMKVGVALTDILTGLYASNAILAALTHRSVSGQGQHIDMALLDVQIAALANQSMNYLHTHQVPRRLGNSHPNVVPYQDFPTSDGYMILAVGNDGQFSRLCGAIGKPEWAQDARFAINSARVAHRDTLIPLLADVTRTRTTVAWVAFFEKEGVPCGPINNLAQAFDDPQVHARGMQIAMDHSLAGTVPLVASPIKLSATPVTYRLPPPVLGEHTNAVLHSMLGPTPDALNDLRARNVIY
ncbi:MAG: CaiB/BaiF CoA-transferase family protein [Burkholderiaceae bacterium]